MNKTLINNNGKNALGEMIEDAPKKILRILPGVCSTTHLFMSFYDRNKESKNLIRKTLDKISILQYFMLDKVNAIMIPKAIMHLRIKHAERGMLFKFY